jgi:hypothetical protein
VPDHFVNADGEGTLLLLFPRGLRRAPKDVPAHTGEQEPLADFLSPALVTGNRKSGQPFGQSPGDIATGNNTPANQNRQKLLHVPL